MNKTDQGSRWNEQFSQEFIDYGRYFVPDRDIFHELDPEDIDKPSPFYNQLVWLKYAGFAQIDVFWMRAGHAIFGGWKRNDNDPAKV